jgi:hypothetical protein
MYIEIIETLFSKDIANIIFQYIGPMKLRCGKYMSQIPNNLTIWNLLSKIQPIMHKSVTTNYSGYYQDEEETLDIASVDISISLSEEMRKMFALSRHTIRGESNYYTHLQISKERGRIGFEEYKY